MKKLKENINLILRGYRIFGAFPKPILLSNAISCLFNAGVPFINIYFSAQILTELTSHQRQDRLIMLVALTIGLNLLAMLGRSLLSRWSAYCDSATWNAMYKLYSDKQMSMDFIDVENPQIQQEISEIKQHQNGMGFGLSRLRWSFDGILSGAIRIVLSITMAFSLFTLKVPQNSELAFLDSPFTIAGVLLALACSMLLAPYLTMLGGRIWTKATHDNNKTNRLFGFYFFEMIGGSNRAKDIRLYDQQRLIEKATEWDESANNYITYSKYNAKFTAASTAVSYLANGLIYLYVASKAYAGAFGIGGIVQYVGAISQFGGGFASLLTTFGSLLNNNPFLEKVLRFLAIPNQKYQGTLSVEKRNDNQFLIEFHDVSFKYPGSDAYALQNINLRINVGQRMAVVGMNGSGKTTLIKLLCRLYDPTEGIITLNGIDIKKYNYDEYMAIFSVVFQDFTLLPFTLGQNVASSVHVDENKVKGVLSQSGFNTRLERLPHGLETHLYKNFEDDGVEVSGGEAQKIALSRALYKNAPFIVLDEPTAALDPIAEFEIYSKFNEIINDKTAIYISHRLSSCRFCHDIAVFHEGRLVQRGSHDDLLSDEQGLYRELWEAQAQYYNEKAV